MTQKIVHRSRKTVGSVAQAAIRAGKSNEQALAAVKRAFPETQATLASVAWYRNRMRQDGEKVKTARELKRMRR